jgi:hypothetical protein
MLLAIVVKTIYIIILVIFIIVFALLHFFLRKINAKKKNNRLTWIGSLILTPIIFIIVILLSITCGRYTERKFSREKWFADEDKRYELATDLIWFQKLDHKNKQELIQLIGKPQIDNDTIVTYYLGSAPESFFSSHQHYLLIKLVNNKVRSGIVFYDDNKGIPVTASDSFISQFGPLDELPKAID